MKRFCLVGKNIDYSLSPLMHNHHFSALGIKAQYELFDIDNLDSHLDTLKQYDGFNITIPYKEEILPKLDSLSPEAKLIGAVNCVKVMNGRLQGYNTDYYGFSMLLKKYELIQGRKKVLVIGSGGAGKAVFQALRGYTEHDITVTNRRLEKARELTESVINYEDTNESVSRYDIVVNCTSGNQPFSFTKVKPGAVFIDINYQFESVFLNQASKLKVNTINGLDMLVFQAVKSFEIWFDRSADINSMYNAIERSC